MAPSSMYSCNELAQPQCATRRYQKPQANPLLNLKHWTSGEYQRGRNCDTSVHTTITQHKVTRTKQGYAAHSLHRCFLFGGSRVQTTTKSTQPVLPVAAPCIFHQSSPRTLVHT
jgi:hypothetical protein